MGRYRHVIEYVCGTAWALEARTMDLMRAILEERSAGERMSAEDRELRIAEHGGRVARWPASLWDCEAEAWIAGEQAPAEASGSRQVVKVLGVYGLITHRAGSLNEVSGGTSAERLTAEVNSARTDPAVKGLVLDVNSPGGSVTGITELAAALRAFRAEKPLEAIANGTAASAAYWLASQAGRFTMIPSGQVGSLGVYSVHEDHSKELEQQGVKVRVIADDVLSEYKAEGSPYEPLSEEAEKAARGTANYFAAMFRDDVAKGRQTTGSKVRANYGKGRMVVARDAVEAGMVDGTGSLEDAVRRVAKGRVPIVPNARRKGEDAEEARALGCEDTDIEPVPADDPLPVPRCEAHGVELVNGGCPQCVETMNARFAEDRDLKLCLELLEAEAIKDL